MYEVISVFHNVTYCASFFFISQCNFGTLDKWNSFNRISKVVQQVLKYLYLNFYQNRISAYIGISILLIQIFFYRLQLHGVISTFWTNKITFGRLSKVVQQVLKYSYINVYQNRISTCVIIGFFHNNINSQIFIFNFFLYWHLTT